MKNERGRVMMTWWMWLILVLLMMAVLGLGVAYLVIHALRALHKVTGTVDAVSSRLDDLPDQSEGSAADPPVFTQPLHTAIERYADAHARILERRTARGLRHRSTWEQWSHSNE